MTFRKLAFFLLISILCVRVPLMAAGAPKKAAPPAEAPKVESKVESKAEPKAETKAIVAPDEATAPKLALSQDRVDPLSKYILTGQIVFGTPGFSLELENQNQAKKVSFAPNLAATIGFGLNYKDYVGATVSFKSGPQANSVAQGSTEYDDFHFNFDFKNFLVETQYQRYNGLYVSNTAEVDSTAIGNILAPNMSMQNMLLAFTYVFRPKNFSIQAALSRTERQIHSGGSWLMGGAATQTTIENAAGLVPSQIRTYFGTDQNMTKDRSRTLMMTGGYAYTISFSEKFFATILGTLGYGWGDSSFVVSNVTSNFNFGASSLGAKIVIAYSGDQFIMCISGESLSTISQTKSMRINSDPIFSQAFFGTRY